jgi:hypothetical protein
MDNWRDKLRAHGEKLKASKPDVVAHKPVEAKKPFKHHYYIVKQSYHKWDKVKPRFYRLSCTDRLYNKIPPNSTKNVSQVICIKCRKALRI